RAHPRHGPERAWRAPHARQQRRRRLARALRRRRLGERRASHEAQLRSAGAADRGAAPAAPCDSGKGHRPPSEHRERREHCAARVSRPNSGAYSASKFALVGWTDALHAEEAPNGVHVGVVLPGFVPTEGFPAAELKAKAATRWILAKPETVAEAIVDAGPGGKAERYVPRAY